MREEVGVVPRLLDEVADAAAHRLDREVHRAPPGHHDDRQQLIEVLDAGEEIDALAARRGVPGVVEIHQQQIELPDGDGAEDRAPAT